MRTLTISVLSILLTLIVITNAYYQKKQFYPSVVYITKSNPSMAVIYIQAFIFVWISGKLMRRIFFGQLRTTEFEHLMERSWYAITETCLAFTVFRDDFNPKFVALFTVLLYLKSFHWLAEDRVDYMERSPVISWLFHIRVLSLLLLLGSLDLYFIQHAYVLTVDKGASVQLVFGFEYAILLTVIINIAIKYGLHSVDLNSETPWDTKAVFLLYTELVMGFIKVLLYLAFVVIMVRIYTLPLFAFRPMYYTIRNFKKAFSDVILSRRAIHNMNTLYPDATPEELQAADNVCIICREEMTTASKKLPCNHIFHTSCLRSWFQRQQTCPTCRLNILRNPVNNNNMRNAPAGAQPQQRPPMPQAAQVNMQNPFLNPLLMAAAQNPLQMFNQPQAQVNHPANANAQQQQQAAATATPVRQLNDQQMNMPPPPPPFAFPPFPFMPFMPPPPMPPQNLEALSPDELRRMEGNERENVEARIRCLRNIQILLDAAIVMMQQYSTTVTFSQQQQQMPTSSASSNSTSATSNTTTFQATAPATRYTANAAATSSSSSTSSQQADSPKIAKIAPTTNSQSQASTTTSSSPSSPPHTVEDVEEIVNSATTMTPSISKEEKTLLVDEASSSIINSEEEIRRRRLQKFQQAAANGSTTTTAEQN